MSAEVDGLTVRGSQWDDDVTVYDRPAWQSEAACRGMAHTDRDLFFPAKGDVASLRRALAVCASCPVIEPCRVAGKGQPGIWGGLSEKARRRVAGPRLQDCRQCGVRFVADTPGIRFCSQGCRVEAHREVVRRGWLR